MRILCTDVSNHMGCLVEKRDKSLHVGQSVLVKCFVDHWTDFIVVL